MTDILATIDATVDGRCACGCGRTLDPNGASAWFADADCQVLYHSHGATDPVDVYLQLDAALVYPGFDHLPIPLTDPAWWPACCEAGVVEWPDPCPWHPGRGPEIDARLRQLRMSLVIRDMIAVRCAIIDPRSLFCITGC